MFALFDPQIKIEASTLWWIVGGITGGITVIVGTVTKIITKNHIPRRESYKYFQTKETCNLITTNMEKNIKTKIDGLQANMNIRFDDLFKRIK